MPLEAGPDSYTDYELELMAFMQAISGLESGGNAKAYNDTTGASGAFQFLDTTWQGVAPKLGINTRSASQATAEQQWQVAAYLMTQYYKQFNDWSLVAVSWFSGPGNAKKLEQGQTGVLNYSDGNLTVRQYMDRIFSKTKEIVETGSVSVGTTLSDAVFKGASTAGAPAEGAFGGTPQYAVNTNTGGGAATQDPSDAPLSNERTTDTPHMPHGSGSGLDVGADQGNALGEGASPQQVEEWVRQHMPQMAWAMDHPELGPILHKAAKGGWGPNKIMGAVYESNWYQNTADTARKVEALAGTDPATYDAAISRIVDTLNAELRLLGVTYNGNLRQLAETALKMGWTDQQGTTTKELRRALAANSTDQTGAEQYGTVDALQKRFQASAAQYLIPMSEEDTFNWAKMVATGQADESAFTSYVADIAKSRFPHLSNAIDQGITPEQYFAPYKQMVAQTLEIAPGEVDLLNNAKYAHMVDYADPKSGERRAMTLSEANRYLRHLPEFRKTKQARDQGAQMSEFILNKFGAIA